MDTITMHGSVTAATISVGGGKTLVVTAGRKVNIAGLSVLLLSDCAFGTGIDPNAGHEHSVQLQDGVITPGILAGMVISGHAEEVVADIEVIDPNSSIHF